MKSLLIFAFSFLPLFLIAQHTVSGNVVSNDGSGIKGVSVEATGTNAGTMTVGNGSFSLNLPSGAIVEKIVFRSKDLKKPYEVDLPKDHFGNWSLYVVLEAKKKNQRFVLVRN